MRRQSIPATLIACLALFGALGGTSLASPGPQGPKIAPYYATEVIAVDAHQPTAEATVGCHGQDRILYHGQTLTRVRELSSEFVVVAGHAPAWRVLVRLHGHGVGSLSVWAYCS